MVLGTVASKHVASWLLQKSASSPSLALRHPGTGEAAPVGERYHREVIPDEDWWLRGNDRSKELTNPPFTFYEPNPLGKKNFQAQCVGPNHSRRVTQMLGRQGHSFSEANVQVLKEDPEARKQMAQKYADLMRPKSLSPRQHIGSRPRNAFIDAAKGSEENAEEALAGSCETMMATQTSRASGQTLGTAKGSRALRSTSSSKPLPKAELRRTMTGKSIVVLPNPRLPIPQEQPDIHKPNVTMQGRPKQSYTLDYAGERLLL